MIINTGQRTDIPAFYSKWFINRIREGFVLVRNPYNPKLVTKFKLNPNVVDVIGFCTKNPKPMFQYLDELKPFGQFWYISITGFDGLDIASVVHPSITTTKQEPNDLGQKAAELLLKQIKGQKIRDGENHIIVVGQTTCSHCINIKPTLNSIAKEYSVVIDYINVNVLMQD